jgi:hypothetical protein
VRNPDRNKSNGLSSGLKQQAVRPTLAYGWPVTLPQGQIEPPQMGCFGMPEAPHPRCVSDASLGPRACEAIPTNAHHLAP